MSSFLCEGTWEIVRVLSCIMRGFFDLVVRNKESLLVSTYFMCEDPVFRIYGIKTVFTGEKLGGFISFIVSRSK